MSKPEPEQEYVHLLVLFYPSSGGNKMALGTYTSAAAAFDAASKDYAKFLTGEKEYRISVYPAKNRTVITVRSPEDKTHQIYLAIRLPLYSDGSSCVNMLGV